MSDRRKVVFCTYSSIYSSIVLKQLIEDDAIDVVAIINSTRVHHPDFGQLRGAFKQIQMSGLRYSSYLFLLTDLFSWFQPFLRFKKNALKTVHGLAIQYNIPIMDTRDINRNDVVSFISGFKPKYLLATHFNQLIKPVLLNLPETECLNIHPSLLPAYKGVDPVFFARLNDEKELGVTLHKMAESFDTGEILSQKRFIPSTEESVLSINAELFMEGAKLASQWISDKEGKFLNQQENNSGNYDSWPTPKQVTQFNKSGKRLSNLPKLWI